MTWLKPSGSCFLIGLVHTRMMPGYSEGRASAALIALSICAGVASAFHWIVITWITVFGLVSAANRPVANIMAAGCEAGLAGFLGGLERFHQVVGDRANRALAVEVPDIDIIGGQFLEALVELREGILFGSALGLGGKHNALALALEGRADHALVIAAHVTAGGVEVGDAEIGGTLDHTAVGSDHAAEPERSDLEPGLAERPVLEGGSTGWFGSLLGARRRRRRRLLGGTGRGGGGGQNKPGSQEATARRERKSGREGER